MEKRVTGLVAEVGGSQANVSGHLAGIGHQVGLCPDYSCDCRYGAASA